MKFSFRYIFPFLIILLLGLVFWKGLSLDPRRLPSALIDKPAPTFTLTTLNNSSFTQKDFIGHVSLLNVWATWCPSCRQGHEALMVIAARYPQLRLYGLNYKDDPEKARVWLSQLGNPYNLVGIDQDGRVGIDWGVYGTPETFVIDKQGIIRYKHVGVITETVWEETLLPLIKKLES